VTDSVLENRRK